MRRSLALCLLALVALASNAFAGAESRLTGKIIDANPGMTQLLRDPTEVMVGSTIAKYLRTDDRALVYEKIGALMSEQVDSIQGDNLMIRADRSEVWVHWTSAAVNELTSIGRSKPARSIVLLSNSAVPDGASFFAA